MKKKLSPLAKAVWLIIALVGAASLGVVAFERGEPVNALWLIVATGCIYAIGYRFHSAWLMATVLSIDPARKTPAERHADAATGLDRRGQRVGHTVVERMLDAGR